MANKLYVGNLNYGTNDEVLFDAFSSFGNVISAVVLKDKNSGQSRGFGFVEMSDENEAKAAISGMNGKDLQGRRLRVNIADERPRENHASNFKSRNLRDGKNSRKYNGFKSSGDFNINY